MSSSSLSRRRSFASMPGVEIIDGAVLSETVELYSFVSGSFFVVRRTRETLAGFDFRYNRLFETEANLSLTTKLAVASVQNHV